MDILKGREAIDKYRENQTVEENNNLEILWEELAFVGFNNENPLYRINNFFRASKQYNFQLLGFIDRSDFNNRATQIDIENLNNLWK